MAVTLAVVSLAGIAVLSGSLVGRLDDQLGVVAAANLRGLAAGRPLTPPPQARDDIRLPSAFLIQLRDADGKPVRDYSVPLREGQPLPGLPDDAAYLEAHAGTPFTVHAASGGGRWRVLIEPIADGSGGTLVVAGALDNIDSTIGRLQAIDLTVSGGVLLILVGIGVAIVRASLRPLVEIEQTAGAIAAGQLSRRVPDRDPRTEIGRLGTALNGMLAQIEAAFGARAASEAAARGSEERVRRFVADASHELRTPLTTIRGFAELYRQGASDQPAELMRRIEEQAIRMGLLVEDLLLLARLDQQRPLEQRPVDLLGVTADAVHDARAVAPDRRIELLTSHDGASAPLVVIGDQARLRQVVVNLMGNALTHTPAGTPVEVRVRSVLEGTPRPSSRSSTTGLGSRGAGPARLRALLPRRPRPVTRRRRRARARHRRRPGRRARRHGRGGHPPGQRSDLPRAAAPGPRRRHVAGPEVHHAPSIVRGSWPSRGRRRSGWLLRGLPTAGSTGQQTSRSSRAGTSSAASASVSVLAESSQASHVSGGRITGIRWCTDASSRFGVVVKIVQVRRSPSGLGPACSPPEALPPVAFPPPAASLPAAACSSPAAAGWCQVSHSPASASASGSRAVT